ncbi:hypothetical protein EDD21DRAFT_417066 [Dissophora ornata]|nr:hypothetical protein EDD21DRAFT_417066 [Dissophora ornata]
MFDVLSIYRHDDNFAFHSALFADKAAPFLTDTASTLADSAQADIVPSIQHHKAQAKMMLAMEGQIQQEFPDQSSFTIVDIDVGICNAATATIINSNDEDVMQNMSISQSVDAFSTKVYHRGLQRVKQR